MRFLEFSDSPQPYFQTNSLSSIVRCCAVFCLRDLIESCAQAIELAHSSSHVPMPVAPPIAICRGSESTHD